MASNNSRSSSTTPFTDGRRTFLLLYAGAFSAILLFAWFVRDSPPPKSEPVAIVPAKSAVEGDKMSFGSSGLFQSSPFQGFTVQRVDNTLVFTVSDKYTDLDRGKRFAFGLRRDVYSFAGVKMKRYSTITPSETSPGSRTYIHNVKHPEINQRTLCVTAWVRPDGADWVSSEVTLAIMPPFTGVDPSKYDVIETEATSAAIKELFAVIKAIVDDKRDPVYVWNCTEGEHAVGLYGPHQLPDDVVQEFVKHAGNEIGRKHPGYKVAGSLVYPQLYLDPATHRRFVYLTARVTPESTFNKGFFLPGKHWVQMPLNWTETKSDEVAQYAVNRLRKTHSYAFEK